MSEENHAFRTWNFEHEGKRWELRRPNVGTMRAYGKHLEHLVLQGINRHRTTMDSIAYKTAMGAWTEGFTNGRYNWKGMLFMESLSDDENVRHLLFCWFQQAEGDLPNGQMVTKTMDSFGKLWEARREDLITLAQEMLTEENPT